LLRVARERNDQHHAGSHGNACGERHVRSTGKWTEVALHRVVARRSTDQDSLVCETHSQAFAERG
jgi:hypothetical protein